jgi:dihydrofolate synthase / folylpolyglutamate synthase
MKGYHETLDYLYGLEKFGMVFGLDNVKWILRLIGNPQNFFKTVHIAGTNGKGSVASMISTTLQASGLKAGAYTSPHLISFTERITVNETPITEDEVVELTRMIRARIDEEDKDRAFTFFDFTTALAFQHFKNQGVEVAVVEVGLGGRLDSTNVVQPLVSVITNVEFDHQEYLGNTIEEIAREKAGVIKDGVPVVTGAGGAARRVIGEAAADRAVLYVLGEDFSFRKEAEQTMSYKGINVSFDSLRISLRGDHQLFNASLALCALEVLATGGLSIDENSIRQGLSTTKWPGRLELIPESPGRPAVLLDGAHNPDGARTLAAFLRTHFGEKNKILVFGVMKDKEYPEMLSELLPLVNAVILTKPEIARSALPSEVAPYAPGAILTDSVRDAIRRAFETTGEKDLVIIAGSFYTIGEAKRLLDEPA